MAKYAIVHQAAADLEIVVAGDDPAEQLIISAAASDLGATTRIEFVDDDIELFDLLEARDDDTLPDLLILDVRSAAVGGHDALATLGSHERFWEVPVLVLAPSEDAAEADRCRRAGAVWFEAKPATFGGYVDLVASLSQRCSELRRAEAGHVDWNRIFERIFTDQ